MPQLKSGRHVGLSARAYLNALTSGPDESQYFAIVALRLNVPSPEALRDHLIVGYFVEGEGTPPNAPCYHSGYSVADVLNGCWDWSADEIAEFRIFLNSEPHIAWRQAQFDELNQAIENSSVWASQLMENDMATNDIDVSMIKRAIILKSAMEPGAMARLGGTSEAHDQSSESAMDA